MQNGSATVRDEQARLLAEPSPRYLWWTPVGTDEHGSSRTVAQIMNIGGYDDILRLEACFSPEELASVMQGAEPGWFSPRSWSFWRGRLGAYDALPAEPPSRRVPGA